MSFELKALKDICTIQIGKTPSRHESDYWRDGTHAWLSIADMNQGRYLNNTKEYITDLGVRASNIKLIPKNTLVLSYKLSIGKVGITQKPMYTNEAIASLTELDSQVDINYLYWALQHIDLLENADRAAMGKTLNKAKLSEVKIPLPPLEEQRRIASILDQADELRQKRQQAIEKLDQLLQATFIDMFGDPVSNPKGWVSSTLGEQCEVGTGSTPSRQNADYFEGNIPWVKSTEVDWGTITYTSETISEDGKNSARLKIYPKGSIILALYGQGITRGKSALLGIEATLNQACAALIPKEPISNYFVFSFLRFSYENLRNQARGGNQENLNLNIVKSFPIYLPPNELQEKWSKIALGIEDQKQNLYKQLNMQNQLFSSLQTQAFNGSL